MNPPEETAYAFGPPARSVLQGRYADTPPWDDAEGV